MIIIISPPHHHHRHQRQSTQWSFEFSSRNILPSYSTCFVLIWIHFKPISNILSSVNMIFPSKDPCLKLKSQVPKKSILPAWNQNYASLLLFFFFLRRCLRIGDGFADSPLVHLPGKATSADNSWTQVFPLKPQNDAPLQVLRKPECWGGRQLLETGILNIKSSHKIAQK